MTSAIGLLLFGATNPTGAAFEHFASGERLITAGRQQRSAAAETWIFCDFTDPDAFNAPEGTWVWVSFAPIWLFASFLDRLRTQHPSKLAGLRGVVCCSSSSSVTKRFAFNAFDRDLAAQLVNSGNQIERACEVLNVSCRILAPTLIYGAAGGMGDRNLSRILKLMRRFPVLPVPATTGLRQPIHCTQLAAVALRLARAFRAEQATPAAPVKNVGTQLALGGDDTLSYIEMLRRLQQAVPANDPARRCRLLPMPQKLIHAMAFPLLIVSPKTFEAVLRVGADLSGFTPAHQLLDAPAQAFPVLPLAAQ